MHSLGISVYPDKSDIKEVYDYMETAAKLGFTKIYAPKNSLHGMKIPEGIQVVGVTTVGEVLKKVFS